MIRAALIALALTAPAMAAPANGWFEVHRGGLTYLMPPAECRVGRVPPYTLSIIPQADLDAALTKKQRKMGLHLYAVHATLDGAIIIYASSSIPRRSPMFRDIVRIHELAHLRGCEHGTTH